MDLRQWVCRASMCNGASENARGYKAHIIAVQEDLTWRNDWNEIEDCVLKHILVSPIHVQVFDGVYSDTSTN